MSELKPGDIRLDDKQIYIVISENDGRSGFLRVWLSSGIKGLSLSSFTPSKEDKLLCNIQSILTSMKEKAARGDYD